MVKTKRTKKSNKRKTKKYMGGANPCLSDIINDVMLLIEEGFRESSELNKISKKMVNEYTSETTNDRECMKGCAKNITDGFMKLSKYALTKDTDLNEIIMHILAKYRILKSNNNIFFSNEPITIKLLQKQNNKQHIKDIIEAIEDSMKYVHEEDYKKILIYVYIIIIKILNKTLDFDSLKEIVDENEKLQTYSKEYLNDISILLVNIFMFINNVPEFKNKVNKLIKKIYQYLNIIIMQRLIIKFDVKRILIIVSCYIRDIYNNSNPKENTIELLKLGQKIFNNNTMEFLRKTRGENKTTLPHFYSCPLSTKILPDDMRTHGDFFEEVKTSEFFKEFDSSDWKSSKKKSR